MWEPTTYGMELKRIFVFKPFWFTWITFVALIGWLPVGFLVPETWGWENGPIENFQFAFLLFGIYASWRASRTYKDDDVLRGWWLWSILAWLIIIGREMSWGRNFFPATPPGEVPVFLGREELSFGPFIHPLIFFSALILVVGLAWNFDWKKLKTTIRIPVYDATAFVICFLCFTLFEQDVIDVPDEYNMRMEEIGETIAYWCLVNIVYLNGFREKSNEERLDSTIDKKE